MESFLQTIVAVVAIVLTFGLAVFVHEFGHMIFALWRGVGVESFAIGMGPRITSWRWHGIDFSLRWLPIGGFVKLQGMVADELENPSPEAAATEPALTPEQAKEQARTLTEASYDDMAALRNKGLGTKLMVFGGGVFMNYVTAIVAMVFFLMMSREEVVSPAQVETVAAESRAERAGLQPGDRIIAVNGVSTPYTADVLEQIQAAYGFEGTWAEFQLRGMFKRVASEQPTGVEPRDLTLTVERDGNSFDLLVPAVPPEVLLNWEQPSNLGVAFWIEPVVGGVHPFLPASKAGLEPGDLIVAINGQPVDSWNEMTAIITPQMGQELQLTVERNGERQELSVTPIENPQAAGQGYIGIERGGSETRLAPGRPLLQALMLAPIQTTLRVGDIVMIQVDFFKRATLSQIRDNVGGPIMIATMTAHMANRGLYWAVGWFITLNLLLAIFNLLPLPVLDGGFIVLSVIESVIRRPVPAKVLAPIYTFFLFFFIGLMLLISFLDVKRFFN